MDKFDFREFFEEHKTECVLGGIALVVLALNAGSIKGFVDSSSQLRESLKAEQADNQRLQTQQLVSEQRREIAEERYRNNCTVIFSLPVQNHYTAITEGQPILKGEFAEQVRKNKKLNTLALPESYFLPAGMDICDVYGNSATLIRDPAQNNLPVVRDLASTGNQNLIAAAKQRARGIYANPVR